MEGCKWKLETEGQKTYFVLYAGFFASLFVALAGQGLHGCKRLTAHFKKAATQQQNARQYYYK